MKRILVIVAIVLVALGIMLVMNQPDNTLEYQKAINSGGLTEVK